MSMIYKCLKALCALLFNELQSSFLWIVETDLLGNNYVKFLKNSECK